MPPFTNKGVNLTIENAMKLAHTIIGAEQMGRRKEALTEKIKTFEEDIFKRTK